MTIRPEHWVDLCGVPFVHGGRDPKRGLDCAGLVEVVYARMGTPVPAGLFAVDYSDADDPVETGPRLDAARRHVRRLDGPEPGCVVAIKGDVERPDAVTHVGVVVARNQFVHAVSGHRVRRDYLDNPIWRIEGYYAWR